MRKGSRHVSDQMMGESAPAHLVTGGGAGAGRSVTSSLKSHCKCTPSECATRGGVDVSVYNITVARIATYY
eukprot:7251924-Pyramimonas_sp.AAC.1